MYTDLLKNFAQFSEQTDKALAPISKFNKLLSKNVEQLTELQLASVEAYRELSLAQMKAAADVNNPEALKEFNLKQVEVLKQVSEQMTKDSARFNELAQDFGKEVQELTAENLKSVKAI